MRQLTQRAKAQRADVVHFSETCLGGYAGAEFKSWDGYDWAGLKAAEDELRQLAKKSQIGLVYGTNHRISSDGVGDGLCGAGAVAAAGAKVLAECQFMQPHKRFARR